MITIKSPSEFAKMRVAGATVAAVHQAVRDAAEPGVTTGRLDALAAKVIEERGCTPSFLGYYGYPSSICASPNSVIVHGIPGDYVLREGDLISVDVGAVYEGYHGDAAISFGVGDLSLDVERLLITTEEAMWAGLAQAVPGNRVGDIGAAVEAIGTAAGYGVVREYVGHGIGKRMHEEPQIPNHGKAGKGMKLRTGMALCVEPMFNLGTHETAVLDDEWTVVTADGSTSCHWEHTIALTEDGPQVFTLPDGAEVGLDALLAARALS